ncbi:MAG: hypothetical protein A3K90_01940 [Pelodictyon luteolum]|uniref:Uncharacterized protein n=1 Tax=Pelodictyon luteolum TaxID=1100 RepID=A0A165L334_PELLU|nr:hypothetical protein [Pelodictyon luteolum]KZK73515.1 MAG: hypothetical protein A3K90_01940 [Pelodictyon luteolum]
MIIYPLSATAALLFLALCPSGVFALDRWDVSASVSSSVEENISHTAGGEDDMVQTFSAGIAPHWKWPGWESELFYDGTMVDFSRHSESSYAVHKAGATLYYSPTSAIRVRGGMNLAVREAGGSTDMYDYTGSGLYCDMQFPLSLDWTARGGLSRQTRDYRMISDLDNRESLAFFGLEHRFQGGASLGLSAEAGAKDYLGREGPEACQLRTFIRVSLPLAEATGLRLRLVDRLNFGGDALVAAGIAEDGYMIEDLYDDPYSYESLEADAMVSQLLSGGVMLRIGCAAKWKSYDRAVLDAAGAPLADLREDACLEVSMGAEKTLRLNRQGTLLKLSAGWYVNWNDSNDALYRYRASSAGVGAELEF